MQPSPHIATAPPLANSYACGRCGQQGADHFARGKAPMHRQCAGLGPDTLPWPWLLLAYGVAGTIGWTLIGALLASLPYYLWRSEYPQRAKRYNRHVWIAFGISCLLIFGSCALRAKS
jgi:hypothetical protein